MTRWTRALAIPVLALTLAAGYAPRPAFGQANSDAFEGTNPEETKGEGRPLDGYLATLALVGLSMFIIGKSARR
jgi:hypothetical protein